MRGLTVWRPWSDAIVNGPKRVENRTWRPPTEMVGELIAIHGGKAYEVFGDPVHEGYTPPSEEDCPTGIVGVARILGWHDRRPDDVRIHRMYAPAGLENRIANLQYDPYWIGPVGWLLDDVRALERPIPHPGALGLWKVPPDKVQQIFMDLEGLGPEDLERPDSPSNPPGSNVE